MTTISAHDEHKTHLRRAHLEDAHEIHISHMNSIRKVCSKDYNKEQIYAWGYAPYDPIKRKTHINDDYVWVAEKTLKIKGYSHLRKIKKQNQVWGFVLGLYLEPDLLKQGIGSQLINLMEQEALKFGAIKLVLDSTKTAHAFYLKQGFQNIHKFRDLEINGMNIEAIRMEKQLFL